MRRHNIFTKLVTTIINWISPYKYVEGVNFDKSFGVDTEKYIRRLFLGKVKGKRKLGSIYAATPIDFLEKTLEVLKNYDYTNFADIGSGKGRVLFFFAKHYELLIGVEYSKKLVDIASLNLAKIRKSFNYCGNMEFVCADASTYELPFRKGVVYLFNPFDGSILERFLKNNINGDYLFVYINPLYASIFINNQFYLVHEVNTLSTKITFWIKDQRQPYYR